MENKFNLPKPSPNDLVLPGNLLGVQDDTIKYVSKKTGLQSEMKRQVIVLQCTFGIVLVRAFNPQFNYCDIPIGTKVELSISEYRIDNGVKSAVLKV